MTVLQSVPDEHDYAQDIRRIEEDLSAIQAKKDRLLEMSIEGVITTAEFKQRNDGFNQQAQVLEERLEPLRAESERGRHQGEHSPGYPPEIQRPVGGCFQLGGFLLLLHPSKKG